MFNVSEIGEGTFEYSSISDVTLSNKLNAIPDYAFQGCTNLVNFDFTYITNIGISAFSSSCPSATKVMVIPLAIPSERTPSKLLALTRRSSFSTHTEHL